MARGVRGLERPPWWAISLMVVGLVVLVTGVSITNSKGRSGAAAAQAAAADHTVAPTSAAPVQTALPTTVRSIVAFGDSYMDEGRVAGQPNGNYLDQLVKQMNWPKPEVFSTFGGGYMSPGSLGTIDTLVAKATTQSPDLVIVQGGRNDYSWTDLQSGVVKTLNAVRARWPHATLLVVGVLWPPPVPADVAGANSTIMRVAARLPNTIPLDMIKRGLQYELGKDGIHPDVDGDRQLAAAFHAALTAPTG